jgi:ankyrin repeat protein
LATTNKGDYAADILKLLIDNGAACDVIDERFFNFCEPIHFALMNDGKSSPKLLDLLLKKRGVNVIHKLNGMTLVHYAVLNKGDDGPEIMKKLLENGAEPNIGDINKQTPLHYYTENNQEYQNIASMTILLQNGGNPNAINEMGDTPVHYAAANEGEQAFEMMELLLAKGGKLDIKNKIGFTPVHFALLNIGICGVKIRELCGDSEKIANLPLNDNGETLLHFMIFQAETKIEQIQALLDN